jgi:hypothetical protein
MLQDTSDTHAPTRNVFSAFGDHKFIYQQLRHYCHATGQSCCLARARGEGVRGKHMPVYAAGQQVTHVQSERCVYRQAGTSKQDSWGTISTQARTKARLIAR